MKERCKADKESWSQWKEMIVDFRRGFGEEGEDGDLCLEGFLSERLSLLSSSSSSSLSSSWSFSLRREYREDEESSSPQGEPSV